MRFSFNTCCCNCWSTSTEVLCKRSKGLLLPFSPPPPPPEPTPPLSLPPALALLPPTLPPPPDELALLPPLPLLLGAVAPLPAVAEVLPVLITGLIWSIIFPKDQEKVSCSWQGLTTKPAWLCGGQQGWWLHYSLLGFHFKPWGIIIIIHTHIHSQSKWWRRRRRWWCWSYGLNPISLLYIIYKNEILCYASSNRAAAWHNSSQPTTCTQSFPWLTKKES